MRCSKLNSHWKQNNFKRLYQTKIERLKFTQTFVNIFNEKIITLDSPVRKLILLFFQFQLFKAASQP